MACFMMLCCVDEVESILSRCLTKVYKRLEQHSYTVYRITQFTVMTQTDDSDDNVDSNYTVYSDDTHR